MLLPGCMGRINPAIQVHAFAKAMAECAGVKLSKPFATLCKTTQEQQCTIDSFTARFCY